MLNNTSQSSFNPEYFKLDWNSTPLLFGLLLLVLVLVIAFIRAYLTKSIWTFFACGPDLIYAGSGIVFVLIGTSQNTVVVMIYIIALMIASGVFEHASKNYTWGNILIFMLCCLIAFPSSIYAINATEKEKTEGGENYKNLLQEASIKASAEKIKAVAAITKQVWNPEFSDSEQNHCWQIIIRYQDDSMPPSFRDRQLAYAFYTEALNPKRAYDEAHASLNKDRPHLAFDKHFPSPQNQDEESINAKVIRELEHSYSPEANRSLCASKTRIPNVRALKQPGPR